VFFSKKPLLLTQFKTIEKMIQASFTISSSDFNAEIFEKIKSLLNGNGREYEVSIKVKPKETREEMRQRIEKSAATMERGENIVHVAGEDFDNFMNQLLTK
jgi:low affinity Fe/Cu permease